MECPAGVRLRFASDALEIKTALRFGEAARPIFTSSLLVDGKLHSIFGPDEHTSTWEGELFRQGQHEQHIFDWWLPNMSRADISSLEIDDGAHLMPAPRLTRRWLAYGASITQGMMSSAPHLNFVARCALELEAEVFNLGVGGAALDLELSQALPPGDFDLVSISYGTNDFIKNVPVEVHTAHAVALIQALRAKFQCPVVVVTIPTWHGRTKPNDLGRTLDDYRCAMTSVTRQFEEVSLAPGDEMLPDEARFFVDNVHPNDEGFAHYATNLLPILRHGFASR